MLKRLTLKPGQPRTKRPAGGYGKRLVCLCYRCEERTRQQVKTDELIVDRSSWKPEATRAGVETMVAVRVGWQEAELRRTVTAAGGKWDALERACVLRRGCVESPGLEGWIVESAV